jgi:hypothetical protein
MTRIGDHLEILRIDGLIVISDEDTDEQVLFPVAQAREVLRVLVYLATDTEPHP